MAYNNHQQVPFWDFVNSFDNHGAGVDHPAGEFGGHGPHGAGFPFGGPQFPGAGFPFGMGGPQGQGWGRGGFGPRRHGGGHGGRGRHGHRRDGSAERHGHGSRDGSPNGEHSEGEAREEHRGPRGPRGCGRHGRGSPSGEHSEGEAREGRHGGPRGPRGFGRHGRGGHHRGGPGGPGGFGGFGHHGRRGPQPPFGGLPGGFDMSGLMESLSAHPLAQAFRSWAEQSGAGAQRSGETLVPENADAENSFIPPIDIFSTEKQYILHVSLPGAKKEDVGVNWDEEKGVLNVAGVVYRHGDEEFLQTLAQSERKVGVFERTVKLPPGNGEKEEVDGDAITAKLEDGVLVVSVPKIEKEWTEVKRVDIE